MTIVHIYEESRGSKYKKREIKLKCDECLNVYLCEPRYKNRALKSTLHFCSIDCRKLSSSNGKLKDKFQNSIKEKYGCSYVELTEFKENQKTMCFQKYGVKSRLESEEILEKIRKTNLSKYGQETFAGSKEHQSKLDYVQIAEKAWKTKIKNGTCSKSKVEDRIFDILASFYSKVERQVLMIRQWVDFYIPILNLYIQIDGVYWHGLNRPKEIIALQKTSQDRKIYKQILRDEKLNQYAKNNSIRLLRITDEQINKMSDADILKMIQEY